jgi:predicted phage gp36 major capsid-like protein
MTEPKYIGLQGVLRTEKEAEMGLYDKKHQRVHMSSEESDCMQYEADEEESPSGADTENAHSKHNPKKAKGPSGKKNGHWMEKRGKAEKKAGTKGALRRYTKTKAGHNIPTELLQHLAHKGGHVGKMANEALRYRGK